jgi:hypothetical protein
VASVNKCTTRATCKTDAEIKAALVQMRVITLMNNNYFDVKNFDNPIVPTIDNQFEFPLLDGLQIEKRLKVRANEVEDYTSIIFPSQKENRLFYSIETVIDRLHSQEAPQ